MTDHTDTSRSGDLVETLLCVDRGEVLHSRRPKQTHPVCAKAADRIETQAREIERLRGLLREAEVKLTDVQGAYATRQYSANLLTRIRAALAGDSHD